MPEDGGGSPIVGLVLGLIYLAISVGLIVAMWRVFEKAGQPGWASIVPIYNVYVLCEIAGKPIVWFILLLIPFVNLIVLLPVSISIAENFNKSAAFGIGLWLLPVVFYPILAFTDAEYA